MYVKGKKWAFSYFKKSDVTQSLQKTLFQCYSGSWQVADVSVAAVGMSI
jgi:hypothetical protein